MSAVFGRDSANLRNHETRLLEFPADAQDLELEVLATVEPVGLSLDRADHVVEAFDYAVGDTVLEVVFDPGPASFDRLEDVGAFRTAAPPHLSFPFL